MGLLVYFQHMFRNRQLYVDHVYIHFQVVYTCVLYLHSLYVQLYSHSCVCVCVHKTVQGRGAAVLKARKLSSAMSASKAVSDHVRDWWFGTQEVCV